MFTQYDKAIAAALIGLLNLLATFGLPIPENAQEVAAAAGVIISTFLVWLIPNKGFVNTN